jgi:hypothetical protein
MEWSHLPHIDRDLTALAHYSRGVFSVHPLAQVRQNFGRSDPAEGLCGFVAHHIGFL